jgi:hypothetical protein
VSNGKIQAVAIDERSDDTTIEIFFGPGAMVWIGLPTCNRLITIPVALEPQAFFIIGAAAVTIADRSLVLECLSLHRKGKVYFFARFKEAELMQ